MLPLIVPLAAVYGGGALLIREILRAHPAPAGRRWCCSRWRTACSRRGCSPSRCSTPTTSDTTCWHPGFVPALGIAVPRKSTVFVLALHTVWRRSARRSPRRGGDAGPSSTTPWLRTPGLVTTAVLFGFRVWSSRFGTSYGDGAHFLGIAARLRGHHGRSHRCVCVVAFRLPRARTDRPAPPPMYDEDLAEAGIPDLRAPGPWAVFATAIVAGVAFMLGRDALPAWPGAVLMLVALRRRGGPEASVWSSRPGMGSLRSGSRSPAGALLTYRWQAAFAGRAGAGRRRPARARDARRLRARRVRDRLVRCPAGAARHGLAPAYSLGGAIPSTGFRR